MFLLFIWSWGFFFRVFFSFCSAVIGLYCKFTYVILLKVLLKVLFISKLYHVFIQTNWYRQNKIMTMKHWRQINYDSKTMTWSYMTVRVLFTLQTMWMSTIPSEKQHWYSLYKKNIMWITNNQYQTNLTVILKWTKSSHHKLRDKI